MEFSLKIHKKKKMVVIFSRGPFHFSFPNHFIKPESKSLPPQLEIMMFALEIKKMGCYYVLAGFFIFFFQRLPITIFNWTRRSLSRGNSLVSRRRSIVSLQGTAAAAVCSRGRFFPNNINSFSLSVCSFQLSLAASLSLFCTPCFYLFHLFFIQFSLCFLYTFDSHTSFIHLFIYLCVHLFFFFLYVFSSWQFCFGEFLFLCMCHFLLFFMLFCAWFEIREVEREKDLTPKPWSVTQVD